MSRTYRRTNETHEYDWILRDWDWEGTHRFLRERRIDPKSREGRRRLRHYHSDAETTLAMAPAWFRRMGNRRHRRRERQKLRVQMRGADVFEDGVFSDALPRKRDLLWDWW